MKIFLKKFLLVTIILVIIAAIYVGGNLIYGTITDFQPPETTTIKPHNPSRLSLSDTTFTFLIWNIGYGGLGNEEDFFFDGGKMVRPSEERVLTNLKGIYNTIQANDSVDFVLIQEVDTFSKRSYYNNELTGIAEQLPNHQYCYATNYSVKFCPVPLTGLPNRALGKIEAGLATYSRYKSKVNTRYQFPGNYDWPKRIYFLDRCFLLQRFQLPNGKDLVLINTHNSAYDDGNLKAQQMDYLRKIILAEYERGNYVVVGGDWNQTPPFFDNNKFAKAKGITDKYDIIPIAENYVIEWQWVYNPYTPTNRKLETSYNPDKTYTTIIDFFLVSPNIYVVEATGIDLDFEFSDHQPLRMTINIL